MLYLYDGFIRHRGALDGGGGGCDLRLMLYCGILCRYSYEILPGYGEVDRTWKSLSRRCVPGRFCLLL